MTSASWQSEKSPFLPLHLQQARQLKRNKDPLLNTQTHLKDPHVGTLKGGRVWMSREAGQGEGQGQWLQTHSVFTAAPTSVVVGEKSDCSPHTMAWRVRSSSPLAKGISLPHCPLSQQLGRGGWEPLNYAMVETAIAGRGGRAVRYKLRPLPDILWQSLIKSKIQWEKEVAPRARKISSLSSAASPHHSEASWSEGTPSSQWVHGIFLNWMTTLNSNPRGANSADETRICTITTFTEKQKKVPYRPAELLSAKQYLNNNKEDHLNAETEKQSTEYHELPM